MRWENTHCRAIVAEAMNAAVAEALAREPALVDALYQVEHGPDGRVSAVQSDAAALNAARVALVSAVQAALEALEEESWQIPLGSLSGWTVLSGLGPARTLTLCPEGYVTGTLEEDAEAVGVNNTRYTLTLVLQATITLCWTAAAAPRRSANGCRSPACCWPASRQPITAGHNAKNAGFSPSASFQVSGGLWCGWISAWYSGCSLAVRKVWWLYSPA